MMLNPSLRPAVERLDTRSLPSSGGISATLTSGVLAVAGTSGDDRIVLNYITRKSGGPLIELQGVGRYLASDIKSIEIRSGSGNDYIALNLPKTGIATKISAGNGNEVIYGTGGADSSITGTGNSVIFGRGGADRIQTGSGRSIVNNRVVVVPAPHPAPAVATPPATATTTTTTTAPTTTTTTAPNTPVVFPAGPSLKVDVSSWAGKIADLTNQQRVAAGLGKLTINTKLTQIAQIAVNQMAQTKVVTHDMSGTQYPSMQNRADAVGYTFYWLGENLVFGVPDPASVVQAWMLSPAHRDNMLFSSFTEMGIAAFSNDYGQVYVALEFGQPN